MSVEARKHPGNDAAAASFRDFVQSAAFPCVGAKSALATDGMRIVVAGDLRDATHDATILHAIQDIRFQGSPAGLRSTAILFPSTPHLSEDAFEQHLWVRLQALHEADRVQFTWDTRVTNEPGSADFGMSIGGAAFFVVGMHPGASRLARRAPMAALAFNPHEQFRRLKRDGRFERLRHVVRERDRAMQGDANPMLADHGDVSEAAQYSGRAVSGDWVCPFAARSSA